MTREQELKSKILDKKDIKSIDENILNKIYFEEKKKNKDLFEKVKEKKFNSKSKEYKEFVKIVRKKLREIYGVFFKNPFSPFQKKKLLESLDEKTIDKILLSHVSTKERFEYFEEVYRKIFLVTGVPKKVLDLGCGFNPFSYFKIGKEVEYIASDISQENMNFINEFFKLKKIKGKTLAADLTDEKDVKKISDISNDCEVVFMFKLLDSLESIKKKSSEFLLTNIKSKYVVVSFPKESISGKNKIKSERIWFKKILEKNYKTTSFRIGPEEYNILTLKN